MMDRINFQFKVNDKDFLKGWREAMDKVSGAMNEAKIRKFKKWPHGFGDLVLVDDVYQESV